MRSPSGRIGASCTGAERQTRQPDSPSEEGGRASAVVHVRATPVEGW